MLLRTKLGNVIFRFQSSPETFRIIPLGDSFCELVTHPVGMKTFKVSFPSGAEWVFPVMKADNFQKSVFGGLPLRNSSPTHFELFFFEGEIYVIQCSKWEILHRFHSENPKKDWLWLNRMLSNASEGSV